MTVTVHRGTHQIGGCVTDLRTKTTRILIDLGSPLPGPEGTVPEENLFERMDGKVYPSYDQ